MNPAELNWLAVFLAALSSFLIGGVWYSPILFGKAWMEDNGFAPADLEGGNPAKIFGGSFVLALIIATNLAMFIGKDPNIGFAAFAGAAAGVGWVSASTGVIFLFERRGFRLFAIHAGYHTLTYTLMGVILGLMG